ncbi:MAG: hypothetical protein ACJAVM_002126 [Sulfitobacter sp.]|jgi:hypothetical protein
MSSEITLNVNGHRVKVDPSFTQLSPDEQEATVEEIAASLGERSGGFMANLNQGIAEGAGGIVDLLNPFDAPHALNPFGEGTGSAISGLEKGMDAIGVNRASGDPQGMGETFARGAGQAAGAAPFGGAAAKALSGAGGLVGGIADDASQAINSKMGFISELFAGGGAQAAQGLAEDAGAPDWAQTTAGILGGATTAGIPGLVRSTPSAIGVRKLSGAVKTAMMPYTNTGGREVARQRVQELAGGPDRAAELARNIGPSEIGLTPAQQVGDPNLLALEQEAMRRNPVLRADMDARADAGQQNAANQVRGMGGNPAEAQSFFEARRTSARENILGFVDRATNGALRPTARNSEMVNSQEVAGQIRLAERAAEQQERQLWDAVPRAAQVGTSNAKQAAAQAIASTPRAQQGDIPQIARELLGGDSNNPLGDFETVNEMHGLYSKLRETARAARAGNNQQRNMARIADNIADAILDDLGAGAGQTDIGRTIDAARAFSAEKHQIFSQGVVGKLLNRTLDGDNTIDPALTLERSLGRGGSTGAVGADNILGAAGSKSVQPLEDYLRSKFDRAAFAPDGGFNAGAGRRFMRDNAELMQRFPYLRDTFEQALQTQGRALSTQQRANQTLTDMQNPSKSISAAFTQAPTENAADAVFKAKRPTVAAHQLAATARKDPDGAALDGLKGAFSDYLIRNSTDANGLSGEAMRKLLQKPETRATFTAVMKPAEIRRLDVISAELIKLRNGRKAAPDIGGLSPRSPNRVIEMVARVIAAKQGAKAGGGSSGASIQTANMASGRVKQLLGNLQNDKAEQLLMDAVKDPELFRLLLTDAGAVKLKPEQINRLAPYFVGAGAAVGAE